MLVRIAGNYDISGILKQTPKNKGEWDNINFTTDPVEECDYLVVFNYPLTDLNVKCREGGRWLFIQEPPYEKNKYLKSYFKYFDKVFYRGEGKNIFPEQIGLPWHVNKSYDELITMYIRNPEKKNDKVSWVTSNSNVNPGHSPRLRFLSYLQDSGLPIELYGRGINPVDNKFDAIFPSKYTLAIENYSDYNYWTEKIADAFLSGSMPIYYGCKNITDYFPENSLIQIDINKPQEAIEIIKTAINENFWDKNIDSIEKARDLVLNKYQLFPYIAGLIKEDMTTAVSAQMKSVYIPHYISNGGIFQQIFRKILR